LQTGDLGTGDMGTSDTYIRTVHFARREKGKKESKEEKKKENGGVGSGRDKTLKVISDSSGDF